MCDQTYSVYLDLKKLKFIIEEEGQFNLYFSVETILMIMIGQMQGHQ